jgi:hypothetical protein
VLTLLVSTTLLFYFLTEKLFNLSIINDNLVYSRFESDEFFYFKPIQLIIIAAASLQPNLTFVSRILSLSGIIFLGFIHLYRTIRTKHYFNSTLDTITAQIKLLKVSFFIAQLFKVILELEYEGMITTLVFAYPILATTCQYIKKNTERALQKSLHFNHIKTEA